MATQFSELKFVFSGESKELVEASKRGKAEIYRLRNEQKKLDEQINKGEITTKKYVTQTQKLSKAILTEAKAFELLGGKVNGVEREMKKLQKVGKGSAVGNANLAIQELGRGISDFNAAGGLEDIGRGLRGSTNNAERFIEIFNDIRTKSGGSWKKAIGALASSFIGPGGIVLGITLLLSFLPQIVSFFQDLTGGAEMSKEEIEKLNKSLQEFEQKIDAIYSKQNQALGKFDDPTAQGFNAKLTSAGNDKQKLTSLLFDVGDEKDNLTDLVRINADTVTRIRKRWKSLSDEEIEDWEKRFKQYGKTVDKLKQVEKVYGLIEEKIESLSPDKKGKSGPDPQDVAYKNMNSELSHQLELMRANKATQKEILEFELKSLEAVKKSVVGAENYEKVLKRMAVVKATLNNLDVEASSGIGMSDADKLTEEFKENIATLDMELEKGLITIDQYIDRLSNLSVAYQEAMDKIGGSSEDVNDKANKIVENGINNIITGFAQAAGKGQDVGKALLSGIGNTLIQLGGMLIATGIGVEAFKDALTELKGAKAIAAGAVMITAGAAFASAANKAGGGNGSTPSFAGGNVSDAGKSPDVLNNNPLNNININGKLTADGTDLVYVFNKGNNIRNQYIGG